MGIHSQALEKEVRKPSVEYIKDRANQIDNTFYKALFIVVYLTASRISEVVGSLRYQDITFKKEKITGITEEVELMEVNLINLKYKKRKIKTIKIPFNDIETPFLNYVKRYLEQVKALNPEMPINMPIFVISREKAYKNFIKHTGVNPHFLRKSRLTILRDIYKADAFILKQYAGWSNIQHAERYILTDTSDMVRIMTNKS